MTPPPPGPIQENLAQLLSPEGYLNPETLASWAEIDPEVPAATIAAAVNQALTLLAEKDQAHAGISPVPPEQDRQYWQEVADLMQQAGQQAIAAQNRMPQHEDPGDPDWLEQQWEQIEYQLARANSEAQAMAHYWRGVRDGMTRRAAENRL